MATRLHFANAATPYSPATYHGTWNDTASAVSRLLGPRAGSNTTIGVAEAVKSTSQDVLLARFVSLPLVNAYTFTASDTINWCVGILESDSAANDYTHIHIWVTQGDSNNERGVLLADQIMSTEWPTSAAGRSPSSTIYCAGTVNALAGDRIVVEFGYDGRSNSTTSYTGTAYYGGTTGTDLTDTGDTNVATREGWIEFSGDFDTGLTRTAQSVKAALWSRLARTTGTVTAVLSGSSSTLSRTAQSVTGALARTYGRAAQSVAGALRATLGRTSQSLSAFLADYRDVDFITSSTNPIADACEVRLTPVVDPGGNTGHDLRYRYRKAGEAGRQIDLTVALYDGATAIATYVHTDIGGEWTAVEQTLAAADADSIVNYADLRVRLTANTPAGSGNAAAEVSWIEFEVPAEGAAIYVRTAQQMVAALLATLRRTAQNLTAALSRTYERASLQQTAALFGRYARPALQVTAALSRAGYARTVALVTAALQGAAVRTAQALTATLSRTGYARTALQVVAALARAGYVRTTASLTAALSRAYSRTAATVTAVLSGQPWRLAGLLTAALSLEGTGVRTVQALVAVLSRSGYVRTAASLAAALSRAYARTVATITAALGRTYERTALLLTAALSGGSGRTANLLVAALARTYARTAATLTAALSRVYGRTAALVTAALEGGTGRVAALLTAALSRAGYTNTAATITAALSRTYERLAALVTASLTNVYERAATLVEAVLAGSPWRRAVGLKAAITHLGVLSARPCAGVLTEAAGYAGALAECLSYSATLGEQAGYSGSLAEVIAP